VSTVRHVARALREATLRSEDGKGTGLVQRLNDLQYAVTMGVAELERIADTLDGPAPARILPLVHSGVESDEIDEDPAQDDDDRVSNPDVYFGPNVGEQGPDQA